MYALEVGLCNSSIYSSSGARRGLVVAVVALGNSSRVLEPCTALDRLGIVAVACGSDGGAWILTQLWVGLGWQ
jgi:hypothetical protein